MAILKSKQRLIEKPIQCSDYWRKIVHKRCHLIRTTMVISLLMCSPFGSAQATSLEYNPDGTVQGYSLPGINPAGSPNFENNTSISWDSTFRLKKDDSIRRGTATLNATYDAGTFLFNTTSDSYLVTNGSYTLSSTFTYNTNTGLFEVKRGSVVINGDVDTANGTASGNLFTASLDSWAFDNTLIGFNTTINHRKSSICGVFGCTTNESAYLSLLNDNFDPLTLGNYTKDKAAYKYAFTSGGLAVTTIPIPAAAWLFGSGLIGLIGIARRRLKGVGDK